MFLNGIMPTENESTVKEAAQVLLNYIIMKLLNLRIYRLYKDMRFPWFVLDFFKKLFCLW